MMGYGTRVYSLVILVCGAESCSPAVRASVDEGYVLHGLVVCRNRHSLKKHTTVGYVGGGGMTLELLKCVIYVFSNLMAGRQPNLTLY